MEHTRNKIIELPICFNCKHFNDDGSYTCTAFPKGIPDVILFGDNEHSKPLKGQENSITFTPKSI